MLVRLDESRSVRDRLERDQAVRDPEVSDDSVFVVDCDIERLVERDPFARSSESVECEPLLVDSPAELAEDPLAPM